MKKLLLSSVLVTSLFALEENYIELGAGYFNHKDNFSTNSEKKIANLNNAKQEKKLIPVVNFYFGDMIDEDLGYYISSEYEGANLGLELDTKIGLFNAGIFFSKGEEWENPYLLNKDREKTDTSEIGGYLSYLVPITKNYTTNFIYNFAVNKYDSDKTHNFLKREGKKNSLAIENILQIDKTSSIVITPIFEQFSADGKASSYKAFGFEASISSYLSNDLEVTLLSNLLHKKFERSNPELNKKIDSNSYMLGTNLKYNEPLGYKNSYLSFTVGYEKQETNHNFYDKATQFGMLSVGYKF